MHITCLKHQTHWTHLHMKEHNCWERPCVYIFFKVQNQWPSCSSSIPTFTGGRRHYCTIWQSWICFCPELLGVRWFLLSHLWQKDFRPTGCFSSCWYTLFFSLMSYCEPGRLNRQALPPSYSPTFYSHIKCPKENASRGFISRFMES